MNFAETHLGQIRSALAVVVLQVESGDAELTAEARIELERIQNYLDRIRKTQEATT